MDPLLNTTNSTDLPLSVIVGEATLTGLSLLTTVVGLPTALLQLTYLIVVPSERTQLINQLFLMICIVDVGLLIFYIPVIISYLAGRDPVIFGIPHFCTFWRIGWFTLSRLSIFTISLLSVARTRSLICPFSSAPRARTVVTMTLCYLILMIVQSTSHLWDNDNSYVYVRQIVKCGPNHPPKEGGGPPSLSLTYTIITTLEVVVPLFAVTLSGCLSVHHIKGTSNRATVTILLMTGVYIVLNTPIVMFYIAVTTWSFFLPDNIGLERFVLWYFDPTVGGEKYAHFHNFAYTLSVPLNSLCNVIIWISRSEPMRKWLDTKARKVSGRKKRFHLLPKTQNTDL
eukprot:sb/3466426/